MARSLNRVLLLGRLTRSPLFVSTDEGEAIGLTSVACNWKTSRREGCEFVPVEAGGGAAEQLRQLRKGDLVRVEGRLVLIRWMNDAGENRQALRVAAREIERA